MSIGKVVIVIIVALALSPLIIYLALPSYSTSAASVPVVNNLVVVADAVFVNEIQVETKQATLQQGDSIKTSATGRALINFFDGSSTQLEPDTVITVDELSLTKAGSTTVQFTQHVGKTWSRVAKLVDTKSSFNIQTAAAVAVIRGTLIAIDVQEGDGNTQVTEVKVFEGLSDVVAKGKTVQVGSGKQTTVNQGQQPGAPVVVPPPPAELDINVASPVWLHVADSLERNAGIVPPGFDTNEIPYSTNSGALGEPQNVHITEPLAGTYYVMMHARGDGPVTLSIDGFNEGSLFDQRAYATFNVASGGTYYVTVEIDVDAAGLITAFDASNVYLPPQSDFTTDKTTDAKAFVVVDEAVQFTGNYGSGYYTSCLWNFGDGATSTLCNPSHTYTTAGVYTVSHVVDNPVARQTKIKTDYITVYSVPQADFTSNYTEVVAGDSVSFYDASTANPTAWAWDFGDDTTSTDQNPSHTYASTGRYTVSLTASNLAGSDTETKTGYVKVYAPIVADLAADKTSTVIDAPVQFTDSSVGVASSWDWEFGDGATSTEQNPAHAYASTGTYSVSLYVSNPLDSDTVIKTGYITVYPQPVAAFTADETSVAVGTTIDFTDQSTGSPTAWAWDFGDGGTGSVQNPSHTFNISGVYDVLLTASNPGGGDDELKVDYITVYAPPEADFSADDTAVQVGQVVQFADLSTGVPSLWQPTYDWDFGDGSDSTDQNPTHSYTSPGTYIVSLTVTSPSGADTETKTDYILVHGLPEADFSADIMEVEVGQPVQFTDLSTGEPSAWQWEFGDESGSTNQNPIYAYDVPGIYTVSLMVTNATGVDTIAREGYIFVYEPAQVVITSPSNYENHAENLITVEGSVVGMMDGEVSITVNDSYYMAFVSEEYFSQQVRIFEGENTITVESSDPAYYGSDSVTVYGPPPEMKVVLTWDGEDSNINNHLVWPQYPNYQDYYGLPYPARLSFFDCYYRNMNPDWDYNEHSSSGDPYLNDDVYGGGDPEIITIDQVYTQEGEYNRFWVFINYYPDDGQAADVTATVDISINGELVQTYSRLMEEGYLWECAHIDWGDGTGTVTSGGAYYPEGGCGTTIEV